MVTYVMCTFMHLESQIKSNNCPSRTHLVPRLVVSTEQVLFKTNEDHLCKLSSLFTMVAMAAYIIYFIVNFSLQLSCNVMQRNQVLC